MIEINPDHYTSQLVPSKVLKEYEGDGMSNFVTTQVRRLEENVVTRALTNFLGREPNHEDTVLCLKKFHDDYPGQYVLEYDKKDIGIVEFKTDKLDNPHGTLMNVKFIPI